MAKEVNKNKKTSNKNTKSNKPTTKKVEEKKEIKKEVVKEEVKESKDRGTILAIIGIVAVVVLAVICFVIPEKEKETLGKRTVIMTLKDYGDVTLELDGDNAPITVSNFLDLVNSGFYDGLSFHRILKDFMAQGGSPSEDGNGGSSKTIKGEFLENGIENKISHERGTISMARGEDNDSASSQFFIVVGDDWTSLDGYYAAFGKVVDGMDLIDKMVEDYGTEEDGILDSDKRPIIEKMVEVVNE